MRKAAAVPLSSMTISLWLTVDGPWDALSAAHRLVVDEDNYWTRIVRLEGVGGQCEGREG
jgi:hypothetical protein